MTAEFVLLIILGYLIGSVPSAYLAGKWFCGIDIREHGSGNVGATNLTRATSWRVSLPAIVFDIGKGMLRQYG
jgi:glycerol-3-phosphate acyltransferase PlsY